MFCSFAQAVPTPAGPPQPSIPCRHDAHDDDDDDGDDGWEPDTMAEAMYEFGGDAIDTDDIAFR